MVKGAMKPSQWLGLPHVYDLALGLRKQRDGGGRIAYV